jgi:hypothetical protein
VISTAETEPHLEAALAAAGFHHDQPDPRLAWRAFRDFATVPVSVAHDDFLFECGVFTFEGRARFHWSLTRQFTHEEDGEYAGMEQLRVTLHYEPTDDLRELQTALWSQECASFAAWCARVEALPGFAAVLGRRPVGCEISQDEV